MLFPVRIMDLMQSKQGLDGLDGIVSPVNGTQSRQGIRLQCTLQPNSCETS